MNIRFSLGGRTSTRPLNIIHKWFLVIDLHNSPSTHAPNALFYFHQVHILGFSHGSHISPTAITSTSIGRHTSQISIISSVVLGIAPIPLQVFFMTLYQGSCCIHPHSTVISVFALVSVVSDFFGPYPTLLPSLSISVL